MIYAHSHPELTFQLTRVGCDLAGYTDSQIAPATLSSLTSGKEYLTWATNKPVNLKLRAGFSLSREAIIELHRILGLWIESGNDSLDNDYYLAC